MMSFVTGLPSSLGVLLYLQPLYHPVFAQNSVAPLPTFGNTVQVLGAMEQTNQLFQDGFSIDILSPKNRTLTVQQNASPLGAQFVTGTREAAEQFVALSNYSYIINMNEQANNLIARLAIPYDPTVLTEKGVQAANTYVATLAPDKKSWFIDEATRNIQRSQTKTGRMKMTSITGEYLLVGRQTSDMGFVFVQYGNGPNNTVRLTGGAGIQEAEFIDGLRVSVQTDAALEMTVELNEGVNPGTVNDGEAALNSFMWVVRTNAPFQEVEGTMLFPFNRNLLVAMRPDGVSPTTMLTVGRRALNATSGTFLPFNEDKQVVRELPEDNIMVSGIKQLDGQYLMIVTPPKNIKRIPPPS